MLLRRKRAGKRVRERTIKERGNGKGGANRIGDGVGEGEGENVLVKVDRDVFVKLQARSEEEIKRSRDQEIKGRKQTDEAAAVRTNLPPTCLTSTLALGLGEPAGRR